LRSSRTGLDHQTKVHWISPSSPACCFSACAGSQTTQELLLTDIQMPKMGGPELARRANLLRPRMRVLFVSGDAAPALTSGRLDPDAMALPKPFSQGTLAARVDYAFRE
jgi:CheY-like chemotaxis protein